MSDQAWADQEAAAMRDHLAAHERRETTRLDAHGIGPLSAAEIVVIRERLGLSQRQLATLLGVSSRAVERWERAERGISDKHLTGLEALADRADALVAEAIAALEAAHVRDQVIIVYRSDAHLREHHPDAPFPASWGRAIAGRVYAETSCTVIFAP